MTLPRSAPSAQDIDADGVLAFVEAVERRGLGLHSLMVARRGHVVAQGHWRPYAAERAQLLYSLSKSLTSTAIGFLVQEGRLGLDDPVLALLPESGPGGQVSASATLDERWSRVTVRHCLTMTVGHDVDGWAAVDALGRGALPPGVDLLPGLLAARLEHEPGTTFTYNQVATYLLSLVVRHVTGDGLVAMLRPRLLDPLGIAEIHWHTDPLGRELGFTGAHLTTESLLHFAQFLLDRGIWQGRRLLDDRWFEEATVAFGPRNRDPQAEPDWDRGYGFSYWIQRHGYRGDGAYGQFAIVLPQHDTVVAITAEQEVMQHTLDELWAHLIPAIGRAGAPGADERLALRLTGLGQPAWADRVAGPEGVQFARAATSDVSPRYDRVEVVRADGGHVVGLRLQGEWLRFPVGSGAWTEGELVAGGQRLPVVASGGWTDADTFFAEVLAIETPHRFRIEGQVSRGEAQLRWRLPPLMGNDPLSLSVRRVDAVGLQP